MDMFGLYVAIAALVISIGAAWQVYSIRKYLKIDDLTPTEEVRKARAGGRYKPMLHPDVVPADATEAERKFFHDFKQAADYLNRRSADTPWSFEDTGYLHLAQHSGTNHPCGRTIIVRYNQEVSGRVELTFKEWGSSDTSLCKVRAELTMPSGRSYSPFYIRYLVAEIVELVGDIPSGNIMFGRWDITAAMVDTMWQHGGDTPNAEFVFSAEGHGKWFMSVYGNKKPSNPARGKTAS